MKHVVADADILSQKLLPHAVIQAGAFVPHRRGGKVVKHKPDQIEHRRRLENHCVTPRRQLRRFHGKMCFFASPLRELLRMHLPHVGGIRFGPACRRIFLHGNRELRMRFAVRRKQPARIAHCCLALPARKNSRRHLSFLSGEIASQPDRARPLFGSERSRCLDEPVHRPVPLPPRHRQQSRIARLAVRQGKRRFDRRTERVFVQPICGRPRGAPAGHRANRNRHHMFENVLVNAIIRKARQRIGHFIHVDFRFHSIRGFGQSQNGFDNSPQFARRQQVYAL